MTHPTPFITPKPSLFRAINVRITQAEFDIALVANIRRYWKAVGARYVRVRTKVIDLDSAQTGKQLCKMTVLRSNLRNGLPVKWKVA